VAFLDDLHEQLAAVRVEAALACEPLAPEARAELARALAALPTAQLEAALGLVLPQVIAHFLAPAPGVPIACSTHQHQREHWHCCDSGSLQPLRNP
jgi:hypothetical protein